MKNTHLSYKVTIFDYFVIIFFLLLSGIVFVVINQQSNQGTTFVIITQNDKIVYKDLITKEQNVKLVNAIVEIKNNKVRIKQSSCPFKICVHTGWISKPYQQIICVPNKICIKIIANTLEQGKIDSVTY